MTITSSELHWNGWVGSQTDKKNNWVAVWRVITDNHLDGPLYVIQNYGGAQIGDPYSINNESDPFATCTSVVPNRAGGENERRHWMVVATFETPSQDKEDDNKPDQQGNQTGDPLRWAPTLSASSASYTVAVHDAKLIGLGFSSGPDPAFGMPHLSRPPGSRGPVINSSGTVLNPPFEKNESIVVYRITKNFRISPVHDAWVNSVNSDTVTIVITNPLFARTFAPRTLYMDSIDMTPQRVNGVDFWQVAYEFHWNKKTWARGTPDIGYTAVPADGSEAAADDPGAGGVVAVAPDGSLVSETTSAEDIVAGTNVPRLLTDDRGYSSPEPVLLDGHGHALKPTADPLFLYYLVDEERSFTALQMDRPDQ